MREEIIHAAETVWSLARDLASARADGTSLNSQRNTQMLARVITAFAKEFAADFAAEHAISTASEMKVKNKDLSIQIGQLKLIIKTMQKENDVVERTKHNRRARQGAAHNLIGGGRESAGPRGAGDDRDRQTVSP